MQDLDAFLAAFERIPVGTHRAMFRQRGYIVTKSSVVNGAGFKLVAAELGGADYISLNLYALGSGPLLKPCEMPKKKVMDFVTGLKLLPS